MRNSFYNIIFFAIICLALYLHVSFIVFFIYLNRTFIYLAVSFSWINKLRILLCIQDSKND